MGPRSDKHSGGVRDLSEQEQTNCGFLIKLMYVFMALKKSCGRRVIIWQLNGSVRWQEALLAKARRRWAVIRQLTEEDRSFC